MDCKNYYNKCVENLYNTSYVSEVLCNPFIAALILTCIIVIIILSIYCDRIKLAEWHKTPKLFFYVYLSSLAVILIHYSILSYKNYTLNSKAGGASYVSSVHNSNMSSGVQPRIKENSHIFGGNSNIPSYYKPNSETAQNVISSHLSTGPIHSADSTNVHTNDTHVPKYPDRVPTVNKFSSDILKVPNPNNSDYKHHTYSPSEHDVHNSSGDIQQPYLNSHPITDKLQSLPTVSTSHTHSSSNTLHPIQNIERKQSLEQPPDLVTAPHILNINDS
jgi:hypothetical protein